MDRAGVETPTRRVRYGHGHTFALQGWSGWQWAWRIWKGLVVWCSLAVWLFLWFSYVFLSVTHWWHLQRHLAQSKNSSWRKRGRGEVSWREKNRWGSSAKTGSSNMFACKTCFVALVLNSKYILYTSVLASASILLIFIAFSPVISWPLGDRGDWQVSGPPEPCEFSDNRGEVSEDAFQSCPLRLRSFPHRYWDVKFPVPSLSYTWDKIWSGCL